MDLFHEISSIVVFILSVFALFSARRAMQRGLTYSSFASVTWTMLFITIARFWHTSYEFLGGWAKFGEIGEFIEYTLYMIAFIIFIWLNSRAAKTPVLKV